jgi:putative SOS response-associated peptidase YedK
MCCRYSLATDKKTLADAFEVVFDRMELTPRYNIAPEQDVLTIRLENGKRVPRMLRWGLIPCWAEDESIGDKTINARAETVATRPLFRDAFEKRRCLVIATGFYEWKPEGVLKQPYHIHMKDGRPFAFAGLWEDWKDEETGEQVPSCTILVANANELVATVYDRMPVILSPEDYDAWLSPDTTPSAARALLVPYAGDDLEAYPVSHSVNSARNDGPELVAPV